MRIGGGVEVKRSLNTMSLITREHRLYRVLLYERHVTQAVQYSIFKWPPAILVFFGRCPKLPSQVANPDAMVRAIEAYTASP